MKNLLVRLLILPLVPYHGSSGVGTDDVSAFVTEGDLVILNTDVQTNQQDEIVWYFNDTRIAQITGDFSSICTDVQCNEGTESFRDRLKLDSQTGSLNITNTRTTDSGEYKLVIISSSSITKIYRVAVSGVPVAQRDKKTKSVKEGDSITIDPDGTKNPDNVMTWYYNDTLIAEIAGDQSQICTNDQCKERFRDRLKLDQTGSLTITDTRNTDSGLYQLQISSSSNIRHRHSTGVTSLKSFSISVTAVPDSRSPVAAAAGGGCGVLMLVGLVVAFAKKKGICRQQNTQNTANEDAEDTWL